MVSSKRGGAENPGNFLKKLDVFVVAGGGLPCLLYHYVWVRGGLHTARRDMSAIGMGKVILDLGSDMPYDPPIAASEDMHICRRR